MQSDITIEDYLQLSKEEQKNYILNQKKKEIIIELYNALTEEEPLFSIDFLLQQFGNGLTDQDKIDVKNKIKIESIIYN